MAMPQQHVSGQFTMAQPSIPPAMLARSARFSGWGGLAGMPYGVVYNIRERLADAAENWLPLVVVLGGLLFIGMKAWNGKTRGRGIVMRLNPLRILRNPLKVLTNGLFGGSRRNGSRRGRKARRNRR